MAIKLIAIFIPIIFDEGLKYPFSNYVPCEMPLNVHFQTYLFICEQSWTGDFPNHLSE